MTFNTAPPGNPVVCKNCGHEWDQDPVYEVDCPTCLAKAGQCCKRPSGHQGPFVGIHAKRDLLAAKRGFYEHDCGPVVVTQLPAPSEADPRQMKLL